MTVRTDPRTHYEAVGDISYNCKFYLMQERFFSKLAGLLRMVTFVAGSSAFAGFIATKPKLAGIAGLVAAVATGLDFIINPSQKAYVCNEAQRRYREIERRAPKLNLEELDDLLAEMKTFTAPCVEALRRPAYNGSCEERSRPDYKLKVSLWERLIAKLA